MKDILSPNFSVGRQGHKPIGIVIHIMDGSLDGTDGWFLSKVSAVSAHYGIGKSGEVHRYVKEENTAWHTGRVRNPSWLLLNLGTNPNLETIAIEHEGLEGDVWPEAQKDASATLIADICSRWDIPIDRQHIIGHYEINSVNRPNCPAVDKKIIDELVSLARKKQKASVNNFDISRLPQDPILRKNTILAWIQELQKMLAK